MAEKTIKIEKIVNGKLFYYCNVCEKFLPDKEFRPKSGSSICRNCYNNRVREREQKKREAMRAGERTCKDGLRLCEKCGEWKPAPYFIKSFSQICYDCRIKAEMLKKIDRACRRAEPSPEWQNYLKDYNKLSSDIARTERKLLKMCGK